MNIERTLSIIKPDAVKGGVTGSINAMIEHANMQIIAQKMIRLTTKQAETFYMIHKDRPFFNDLVSFMTSGPVIVQVLEGENAIAKYRELMGATDPKDAADNTIRAKFAQSIDHNAVHGSDSAENAKIEISLLFAGIEILL